MTDSTATLLSHVLIFLTALVNLLYTRRTNKKLKKLDGQVNGYKK